jgi:hypothetical protein
MINQRLFEDMLFLLCGVPAKKPSAGLLTGQARLSFSNENNSSERLDEPAMHSVGFEFTESPELFALHGCPTGG